MLSVGAKGLRYRPSYLRRSNFPMLGSSSVLSKSPVDSNTSHNTDEKYVGSRLDSQTWYKYQKRVVRKYIKRYQSQATSAIAGRCCPRRRRRTPCMEPYRPAAKPIFHPPLNNQSPGIKSSFTHNRASRAHYTPFPSASPSLAGALPFAASSPSVSFSSPSSSLFCAIGCRCGGGVGAYALLFLIRAP